ncbi:hypothetical protein [Spongiibacter sp.]|uniref:hypothetical protein n=1 Tax=Spongiibacter sp. TaxID=2024860 RepID=UPI000C69840E|nr:hypothetical protein [Spongiibacter sp.]MAY37881.1 hypothetical protein [Spongiibacter sp.]|tara:strand:+ start:316 stop:717 length:402 start_codon:yes stop_codon:yes gene_type:complete
MQIIRVTDAPGSFKDRVIYLVLHELPNFTLYECKGKSELDLYASAETIVLDNLHQAISPSSIIAQVLSNAEGAKQVLLIDQDQDHEFKLPEISVSRHIVIDLSERPCRRVVGRDYFRDGNSAAEAIFDLTRAA